MATHPRTHDAYTVGWVCALPKEQTAAIAMLDERHPNLSKPLNDPISYTLRSIYGRNIVIACLPRARLVGIRGGVYMQSAMQYACRLKKIG